MMLGKVSYNYSSSEGNDPQMSIKFTMSALRSSDLHKINHKGKVAELTVQY